MSDEEVLRSWPGVRGAGLRLRKRRPPYVRYTLLALVIGLPLAAWWLSRDTYPMGSLIPTGQHYNLVLPNLIEGRKVIARSPLWALLPQDENTQSVREQLAQDFGLPEWLLNNFLVGAVHVSGRDLETYSDVLVVTRMTRVGTLLERLGWWSEQIERDYAGGLRLSKLSGLEAWFAVRGRVLVASRDREALIRALVLTPEESIGREALDGQIDRLRDEMLALEVKPDSWPLLAPYVEAAELHVWMSDPQVRMVAACRMTPSMQEWTTPLLGAARPQPLLSPVPGPLRISANFGLPAPEAWGAIGTLAGAPFSAEDLVVNLVREDMRPIAGEALRTAFARMGNNWSLTYRGTNLMAMAPLPYFAGRVSTETAWAQEFPSSFPPLPEGAPVWDPIPRADEAKRYVFLPMPGGVDFQPAIAPLPGGVLLSTSQPDLEQLLAELPALQDREIAGNLLIDAEPSALLEDALALGLQLTDLQLIRGHDAQSLEALFAPWQNAAQAVQSTRLLASHEEGVVTLDLTITFAQQ